MPIDSMAPRWRGQEGRLEVWYSTVSDPGTGFGFWVHHELVAPTSASKLPYVHGWVAAFSASSPPVLERFGPEPATPEQLAGRRLPSLSGATLAPPSIFGSSGKIAWDLSWGEAERQRTVFTFPSWAWEREILPAAQVVPVASAAFSGSVKVNGSEQALGPQARGNLAHIYGHGSAERWGWLHAELGGGDVLEIVSAVSRAPGLRHLKPMAFLQLRLNGHDWPKDPLTAATLFRTNLTLPEWQVEGTVGRFRLRALITIPKERSVSLEYVDPDGSTATCTNSEVADAEIVLERRRTRWDTEARWSLKGCAHSEVGTRP